MDKFCTNCGAALNEGAKFCAKCGTKCVANTTMGSHFVPLPEKEGKGL